MCPADGSACASGAACDTAHFACKAGWRRFSDGQAKCFQPGCHPGSLHEAVGRSVANGQAYAVCTCTGALNSSLLQAPPAQIDVSAGFGEGVVNGLVPKSLII